MKKENKSPSYLPAPRIDGLLERARNLYEVTDDKTKGLINKLFQKLQNIAVCGEDERRELWLTAPRGSIEDFGDYEEYLENEEVENREEFEKLWLLEYPEPIKWYKLITTAYNDIRSVFINGNLVLQIQSVPQSQNSYDKFDLANWLLNALNEIIALLKSGRYNKHISGNLPYRKRFGKILREDYWRIFPEEKTEYLKDIMPDEVARFVGLIKDQPISKSASRLQEMTVGLFFDCCRLGYEANRYDGIEKLTPKELYRAHADGRDEGLMELDETSAEAFNIWYHDRTRHGGHPWEVCRGGNSTHISLYVLQDEKGWWLNLAGSSLGRSVETVKFYLALKDKGLPVDLTDGVEIAAMLTGTDYIGIVSEDIFPRYCSSLFPDERILNYMHLPFEETEQVMKSVIWFPLKEIHFVDEK